MSNERATMDEADFLLAMHDRKMSGDPVESCAARLSSELQLILRMWFNAEVERGTSPHDLMHAFCLAYRAAAISIVCTVIQGKDHAEFFEKVLMATFKDAAKDSRQHRKDMFGLED